MSSKRPDAVRPNRAACPVRAEPMIVTEPLEPRVLFAFSAQVNFQPPSTPVPAGYAPDTGQPFGPKMDGLSYGWGGPNVGAMDRNMNTSPGQRQDTFNVIRTVGGAAVWEIAVPNGTYRVDVMAGDPTTTGDVYRVTAEGVTVLSGGQSSAARWVNGSGTVTVADGRLTVRSGQGIAKINSIAVVQQQVGATPPPVSPPVSPPPVSPPVSPPPVSPPPVSPPVSPPPVSPPPVSPPPVSPPVSPPPVVPPPPPPVVSGVPRDAALDQALPQVLSFARQQLNATLADLSGQAGRYPKVVNTSTGKWTTSNVGDWTPGFFPGSLWQTHRNTGDAAWKTRATQYAAPTVANASLVEDVEFRVFLSLQPLYAATGDAKYRDAILKSAASKMTQYNATVGGFHTSWRKSTSGDARANFGVLMDQMMDMELLLWAAKQTGNAGYRQAAVRHAVTTMTHLVRPDGGSFHWGYFDKATGNFISGETAQGYADNSTWARGQAWGIYGFTMLYRETGDARFLATAKKLADHFLRRLPADKVPNWDFDAPSQFKDSSASAITASALLMMAKVDPGSATTYGAAGRDLLKALTATPYLAQGTNSRSILNRGAWYIPQPLATGESGTVWGDYYFLEAINRYQGKL